MTLINYAYHYQYLYASGGKRFPGLQIEISSIAQPDLAIDVDGYGYVDSGAEYSLFSGTLATSIGLTLLDGPILSCSTTFGESLEFRKHQVRMQHADFGPFELEIGFSTSEIRRNLLGRDFMNLVQIGFRERHSSFFLTPQP